MLRDDVVALEKLARALVEYETLDLEEVKKVVKGEPIRSIKEVLDADRAEMERAVGEGGGVSDSDPPLAKVGQQQHQAATRARGV